MRLRIYAAVFVLVLVIGLVWLLRQEAEAPVELIEPVEMESPAVPLDPMGEVAPPEEAAVAAPSPQVDIPQEEPAPQAAPEVTADTLRGLTWTEGRAEFELAADGTWMVNGRPTARWEFMGNRVRIYEPGEEEYFLDIVDGALLFEGNEVVQVHQTE